jgi:hypothetical protein
VATSGTKLLFCGGNTIAGDKEIACHNVDVYDVVTGEWTVSRLTEAKYGITAAAYGNKIYMAGGILNEYGQLSNRVETFDVNTGKWSITNFDEGRAGMAVGYTSSSILFAGGSAVTENETTDRIEILNTITGEWHTEQLSNERAALAPAYYGDKVIFAGGVGKARGYAGSRETSGIVDVYTEPAKYSEAIASKSDQWLPCVDNSNGSKYVYINMNKYRNCAVSVGVVKKAEDYTSSIPVLPKRDKLEELDVTAFEPGIYSVIVEAPGYKPVIRNFEIKQTENSNQQAIPAYAGL